MAQLAKTACCRCREQKVKCDHQLPTCSRCARVNAVCIFPDPPDRKLLAAYRAPYRSGSAKKRKADEGLGASLEISAPPSSFTALLDAAAASGPLHATPSTCAEIKNGLAQQTRMFLVDVYFTHMYNAWLLFHRPTLLAEVETGQVAAHTLVAVYATATIFLPPAAALAKANAHLLQHLGDLKDLGQQWANQAGKEAMAEIVDPDLGSIKTCQILALFWFSKAHSTKNTMFSGIAYKAACVIGLDNNNNPPRQNPPHHDPSTETRQSWLDREIRRRIFWATWLTNCINSEHYTVGTSVNDKILNLPLPVDDGSFRNSNPVPLVNMRSILEPETYPTPEPKPPLSIMAELVKLMMIWASIGDYLEARKHQTSRSALVSLFDLDGRLSAWSKSLPPDFAYSRPNLHTKLTIDQQPLYIFVHALHYQCCLVLHSSIVPQFSGSAVDSSLSVEAISVSARVALKNAHAISELGADLLDLGWDCSRLAPFVGYCMYVSASIHIVFLFSQNAAMAQIAQGRVQSNLKVLEGMKVHWTNLERLWARIHILREAQASRARNPSPLDAPPITHNPRTASSHPHHAVSPSLASNQSSSAHPNSHSTDPTNEIDALAQRQRDTGRLEEPLAASVLEYSLRLKPVGDGDRAGDEMEGLYTRDLERKIFNDPLMRIAAGAGASAANAHDVSGTPNYHFHGNSNGNGTATMQGLQSWTGMGYAAAQSDDNGSFGNGTQNQDVNSMLPAFLQEGGDDWWQSDLDDLTQAMRLNYEFFY